MAEAITLNEELWERGVFDNCCYETGIGLHTSSGSVAGQHWSYFSNSFDSLEAGTAWHRAKLLFPLPEDGIFMFTYFARDMLSVPIAGETVIPDQWIQNPDIPTSKKKELFQQLADGHTINLTDILLTQAKGRYLWFCIEFTAGTTQNFSIQRLTLQFGIQPFTDLLPGCFRDQENRNGFLSRFLAVFETLFLEMQEKINGISNYFDPETVESEFLSWLAGFTGCPDMTDWPEKKQREWIQRSFMFYQKKGTLQGMAEVLQLFTGTRPGIVETYRIMDCYTPVVYEEAYRRLYGDNIYSFFVFFTEAGCSEVPRPELIRDLIHTYQPAHTQAEFIVLKSCIVLGQHCYLGINSTVASASIFRLDNTTVLPFQTTLTDSQYAKEKEQTLNWGELTL